MALPFALKSEFSQYTPFPANDNLETARLRPFRHGRSLHSDAGRCLLDLRRGHN
jgi:hypothetical protein